jgi:uncharacterized protein (UPF0548 family)
VLFSRSGDDRTLARLLDRAETEPLSYPEVGASLGVKPSGYRHDDDSRVLGAGTSDFERAVAGLREWRAHRGAGVRVLTSAPSLTEGVNVAMALPLVGAYALATCRIVAVVDEPDRFGFAYGTLPAHPERGEEAFIVVRDSESVMFEVSAFSRPADVLARLGAPVARSVQRRVTVAYLDALAAHVANAA